MTPPALGLLTRHDCLEAFAYREQNDSDHILHELHYPFRGAPKIGVTYIAGAAHELVGL